MKKNIHNTIIKLVFFTILLSACNTKSSQEMPQNLQEKEEQKSAETINVQNIDNSKAVRAMIGSDGNVNVTALQESLDSFDNENTLEPYIIAINEGNEKIQKWTLKFGKGSEREVGSVLKQGISNGFDALNIAIKTLPENRREKLKILVDSDLYSDEDFTSDGSSIISSISNLYSIEAESYTILDFAGHTLYSQTKDGNKIVPISITNKKFVSVRNLTIKGHARYAIWCQGCDNVVFDSINLELDGKSDSKNLGLRIAEKGSTWGTNIYIDNIFAKGCYGHAVETMKVDGIFIGTITATDCNSCGLLLNATTNAVVGTVNGTRCSPRAPKGVYAALRTANFVGPDVYIHKINAVECGRGYFSVSANYGITIDEFNAENCYAQAALIQDSQGIIIKSGTIKAGSNSGEVAFCLTNGSYGGTLANMNNTFCNLVIEGYKKCFVETPGRSDYNTFIGCTMLGSSFAPHSLTGAREIFDVSSIVIADGTEEITDGAYMNHTAVTNIKIPASVKRIGQNAFYGCTSLKKVEFENGSRLKEIGNQAFDHTAIESISFPPSVRSFGSNIMSPICRNVEIKSKKIKFMASCAFMNLDDTSEIKLPARSICFDHNYDAPDIYGLAKLAKGTKKETWYFWYGHTRTILK